MRATCVCPRSPRGRPRRRHTGAPITDSRPNHRGGPPSAADLLKAPAMPMGQVLSWTGWYVGDTAGYGWTNQGIDNVVTSTFCNPADGGCLAGPGPVASAALAAAIPPHLSTNPKGFIGGGEFRYNPPLGQFCLGVQA